MINLYNICNNYRSSINQLDKIINLNSLIIIELKLNYYRSMFRIHNRILFIKKVIHEAKDLACIDSKTHLK